MLANLGYSIKIKEGKVKVPKGSLILLKEPKKYELYVLEGHTSINIVFTVIDSSDKTMIWQKRLGHLSNKRLIKLSKRGLTCGDKIIGMNLCKHSIVGKKKREKFTIHSHSERHIGICPF